MPAGQHPRRTTIGTASLVGALAVLAALPLQGTAGAPAGAPDLQARVGGLVRDVDQVAQELVRPVQDVVRKAVPAAAAPRPAASPARQAPTQEPATTPPLHGAGPHGQGTVAAVDLQPTNERPVGANPTGSDSDEEIVVGRSRAEQREDRTYHGHITIAALFGNEVLGVDTGPGQTEAGPLDAIQTGVLDAICSGSGGNLCVSAVRADSATTESGSTNRFSTANASLGGAQGVSVGAAESTGTATSDGSCQTTTGGSSVANASAGGSAVAGVANSRTESRACKGQAPQQTSSSRVLELGGTGVPLPAAGCADGTPDTVTGIPALAPIVCNADDTNGTQATAPYGVREALSVFALAVGTTSVLKATTAASESRAQAPPFQCADGVDNDGDGRVDSADAGCHGDGNAENPGSYDATDDDETDPAGNAGQGDDDDGGRQGAGEDSGDAACADGRDNDGDGRIDAADPGCHTDGNASNPDSYDPGDDSERDGARGADAAQCADGVDNDGDGVSDARDPGCHTDGDASNAASYDPSDDSEDDGRATRSAGALPMTGSDVLGLALGGLVLLAAGLVLRRRPLGAR